MRRNKSGKTIFDLFKLKCFFFNQVYKCVWFCIIQLFNFCPFSVPRLRYYPVSKCDNFILSSKRRDNARSTHQPLVFEGVIHAPEEEPEWPEVFKPEFQYKVSQ